MSKKAKKTAVEIVKPTREWLLDHSEVFIAEYVDWDVEINKQWPLFIPVFFFNGEKKNVVRGLNCLLREYALSWRKVIAEKEQAKSFDNDAFQRHLVDLIPDADISKKADDLTTGKGVEVACRFNDSKLFLDRIGDSLAIIIDPDTHTTGIKALQSIEMAVSKARPFFKQMSCVVKLPILFGDNLSGGEIFNHLKVILEHVDWLKGVDILESYTSCSAVKAGSRQSVEVFVALKHNDEHGNGKKGIADNNYYYVPDAKNWRRGNVCTKGGNFYFHEQRGLVMEFIFKSSVPDHSFRDKTPAGFSNSDEQMSIQRLWAMTYFRLSQWAACKCKL